MGHVALDGTKIKANASRYQRMQEEEQHLKAEIHELLERAEKADADDDRQYGADRRGDELPEELRHRQTRLARIQAAKAALEAEARMWDGVAQSPHPDVQSKSPEPDDDTDPDRAGPGSGRRKRAKGVPKPKAQRNFTDPDSRIMKGSEKQFIQGYNVEKLVADFCRQVEAVLAEMESQRERDESLKGWESIGQRERTWSASSGWRFGFGAADTGGCGWMAVGCTATRWMKCSGCCRSCASARWCRNWR